MTDHAEGWGIRIKWVDAPGHGLWATIYLSRDAAIQAYNSFWLKPNAYRKDRRKGQVLAVRVKLTEKD